MDVLVLIDRLEELVEEARSFPGFGNTAMVDRDAAFDIIDQMRQTIPEELRAARRISAELRLDFSPHDRIGVRIFLCALLRPVEKVDDPAWSRLGWRIVKVFTAE